MNPAFDYLPMNASRMIPIVAITFVLVMSFLFSCNKNYPIPDDIIKAQALMLERPDSALLILEGMKGVEHLPAKLKATYNLCLIEARDKNYIVHTSDSLINMVVAFFEKEDDPLMKAKAYYYQGRVNKDLQNSEKAAFAFKKAETFVNETSDYRLKGLICSQLGGVFYFQRLFEDAIVWHEKAKKALFLAGDSASTSYIIRDMGRAYALLKEYDKALTLYNDAYKIADDNNQISIAAGILYDIALLYNQRQIQDSVIVYIKKALIKDSVLVNYEGTCLTLADEYRKINKLDSARIYLNRCANSNLLFTKAGYYYVLANIEEDAGNYKKSLDAYKISYNYQDSIRDKHSAEALAEVVAKYDNEKLENEKNVILLEKSRAWSNFYLILSGSLLLTIAFVYIFFTFKRRKESQLRESVNKLIDYEKQIADNMKMLKANEIWIRKTTKHMADTSDELAKKEYQLALLRVKTEETIALKKDTEKLERTLHDLKDQISSLSKKKVQIIAMNEQIMKQTSFIERLQVWVPGDPLIAESEWAQFSELMNEHFDNFSKKLEVAFPDLTTHDVRICNLIRLGISNETIAKLTNCKYESLLTKRTRIKKLRMHIDGDITLEDILQKIE